MLKRFDHLGHARALTWTCFHRREFLRVDRTRQWLVEAILDAQEAHGFRIWAWVFMPEHVHLIVLPSPRDDRVGPLLKSVKQSVSRRAVHWVRKNNPGSLAQMADVAPSGKTTYRFWQRGAGHDRNLFTAPAIWNMIDYVYQNPVRRGLVERPEEWDWSSARTYAKLREGPLPIDVESLPRLRARGV